MRLELGASASLVLRKSRLFHWSCPVAGQGCRFPRHPSEYGIGIVELQVDRNACLLGGFPLGDVVACELRRSEASGRVYKKENEMLRKKDKETKVPGITKSILERGGCLRPLSIAWKRSFPRIVFQKELQTVLYYLHIGVFVFFIFPSIFRCISRETDAVKFAYTRFVIKLGSNAVSNAHDFPLCLLSFHVREIYCAHSSYRITSGVSSEVPTGGCWSASAMDL